MLKEILTRKYLCLLLFTSIYLLIAVPFSYCNDDTEELRENYRESVKEAFDQELKYSSFVRELVLDNNNTDFFEMVESQKINFEKAKTQITANKQFFTDLYTVFANFDSELTFHGYKKIRLIGNINELEFYNIFGLLLIKAQIHSQAGEITEGIQNYLAILNILHSGLSYKGILGAKIKIRVVSLLFTEMETHFQTAKYSLDMCKKIGSYLSFFAATLFDLSTTYTSERLFLLAKLIPAYRNDKEIAISNQQKISDIFPGIQNHPKYWKFLEAESFLKRYAFTSALPFDRRHKRFLKMDNDRASNTNINSYIRPQTHLLRKTVIAQTKLNLLAQWMECYCYKLLKQKNPESINDIKNAELKVYGDPYQENTSLKLLLTSEEITIYSAGRNHKDDLTKVDDIGFTILLQE